MMPEALDMALAAEAYAKSELMWYFSHTGENLPPAPAASGAAAGKLSLPLLAGQPPAPQIAQDGHVVTLIAAVTAVYDLLVRGLIGFSRNCSMRLLLNCLVGSSNAWMWIQTLSMHPHLYA